jgi:hypothetical protein
MTMEKGEFFALNDRYLYYDYEDALFFWDHQARRVMMKFIGDAFESEVPHDHRIFNEAILSGREVTRAEYLAGQVTPVAVP